MARLLALALGNGLTTSSNYKAQPRMQSFRPADVEQINGEVAKFLDSVTQGGQRLR